MREKNLGGPLKMHIFWSTSAFVHPVSRGSPLIQDCRIDSLNVRHDSEIDWKTLPDSDWNLWSPHILQRRWTTMKRSIKCHETMPHQGKFEAYNHVPPYLMCLLRYPGHPTPKESNQLQSSSLCCTPNEAQCKE